MTLIALVVVAVLVAFGFGAFRLMRANADPRRARLGPTSTKAMDPFTLGEPWRLFVRDALKAQTRFQEAVQQAKPGPLRDRLAEIGTQLDEGVRRCWATAQQGQALRDARKRIDTNQVSHRIAQIEGASGPEAEPTLASLRAQLGSAERLDTITAQAESRLRLLQAQLEEAVARAAELSVHAGDVGELAGVSDDITQVADQMEALRLALEETSGGGAPAPN